jgi:hypothetical protein
MANGPSSRHSVGFSVGETPAVGSGVAEDVMVTVTKPTVAVGVVSSTVGFKPSLSTLNGGRWWDGRFVATAASEDAGTFRAKAKARAGGAGFNGGNI